MKTTDQTPPLFKTLAALLRHQATTCVNQPAIQALDQAALSYQALWEHVEVIGNQLKSTGIRPSDKIALLLPNGAEMATAFLATASVACAAPLNPAYRKRELAFYFSDLQPKILLVDSRLDTPARELAQDQGITVIELSPCKGMAAGLFTLSTPENTSLAEPVYDNNENIDETSAALILHTSGTTSRPKQVPLSHANIAASAENIIRALNLGNDDCGLNIMPLFHIHGLVAGLIAPLASGGRVVCTPGLDPESFFDWLTSFTPSWYSAVPTMHQIILEQARMQNINLAGSSLRFIRSSSAALPSQLLHKLEDRFKCPVIEAYGMTEATHQIASNPLPPRTHKAGSVGLAAGPEIAIMDNNGLMQPPGDSGEIVIRGKNLTAGYTNNPEANRDNFINGWFKTGDQGYLDAEGYLFITGRLKEIINRGGDNIQPREIDEALMDLDGICQAVAFARPHPTLGEDVAAAVTITPDSGLSEAVIRAFAFERLADYKVPSQIIIVDEIPRGATGKLQRLGLAELLYEQLSSKHAAPGNDLEQLVHDVFIEVLGMDILGIHDNFFALGGDSITAMQVITRLQDKVHTELPTVILFQRPTVSELADYLASANYPDPASISIILAELENLSEDEAREILSDLEG